MLNLATRGQEIATESVELFFELISAFKQVTMTIISEQDDSVISDDGVVEIAH